MADDDGYGFEDGDSYKFGEYGGGDEGGGEFDMGDMGIDDFGGMNDFNDPEPGNEPDEPSDESPELKMENEFFNAKEDVETDPEKAIKGFKEVLRIESEDLSDSDRPHNRGFQASKWLVKTYHQVGKKEDVKKAFAKLVKDYDKLLVEKENAITKLLDALNDYDGVADFFQMILDKYAHAGSTKASLRLELKQAKIFWRNGQWDKLGPVLQRLHDSCKLPDGGDDLSKGNQLLEIYALRISRATEKNNLKEQKHLYINAIPVIQKSLGNPRMTGIIHECGGKMELREGHFEDARSAFFEAFKSFDEGNATSECQSCLKNLVLANMLSGSNIDPFQDRRAKAHENHGHIALMKEMLQNFQKLDLKLYSRSELAVKSQINDRWINEYLPEVRRKLQKLIFLHLVKPYTTLHMGFVEKALSLDPTTTEALIVELVLDQEVDISIDQINRILQVNRAPGAEYNRKYGSCQEWTNHLGALTRNVLLKVN